MIGRLQHFSSRTTFYNFNQYINTNEVTVGGNTYTAWDTSNVANMSSMFDKAYNFDQDLSSWNTSSVTTMQGMFNSSLFNKNISMWNTSSVESFWAMFLNNSYFNQNIRVWDTSSVTAFNNMFTNSAMHNTYAGVNGFANTPTHAFFNQ